MITAFNMPWPPEPDYPVRPWDDDEEDEE